jgi:hypothetical protein
MAKKIPLPPILQKGQHSQSVFILLQYKTDKSGELRIEESSRHDITLQLREFILVNRPFIEKILAKDTLESIYEDRTESTKHSEI